MRSPKTGEVTIKINGELSIVHIDTCSSNIFFSLKEYLNMLSGTKVQRGILIFAGPMNDDKLKELNSVLDEHNTNTFFYMVYNVDSTDSNAMKPIDKGPYHMIWHQVLK